MPCRHRLLRIMLVNREQPALTAAPHERQKRASASSSDAHSGHAFTSGEDARGRRLRSWAHAPQACDPGAAAAPQDGQ